MYASRLVGRAGRVIAFEPAPDVYALLQRNLRTLPNSTAIQCGVGADDSTMQFASQGASTAGSFVEAVTRLNEHWLPETPIAAVSVAVRTIDSLVTQLGAPDVLKIDVEGFELQVLRGAAHLLSAEKPPLIMEIHPPQLTLSGGAEDEIFSILRSHNYSWQVIDRNPNSLYTIAATAQ